MAELKWTQQTKDFVLTAHVDGGFYWVKITGGLFSFASWNAGFEEDDGGVSCITIGNYPNHDAAVRACQEHYTTRNLLLSLQGEAIAQIAEGKLQPVDDELLKWSTLDTITWFSDRGDYRTVVNNFAGCVNVFLKVGLNRFTLIASPKTLHDAKQAAQYHYDATQRTVPAVKQEPEQAAPVEGLSVAFYQVFLQGAWIDCPLSAYTVYSYNGEETRKLCDHSQAEAIIAARDETIRRQDIALRGALLEVERLKAENGDANGST